jgi:hypothetical protein
MKPICLFIIIVFGKMSVSAQNQYFTKTID